MVHRRTSADAEHSPPKSRPPADDFILGHVLTLHILLRAHGTKDLIRADSYTDAVKKGAALIATSLAGECGESTNEGSFKAGQSFRRT